MDRSDQNPSDSQFSFVVVVADTFVVDLFVVDSAFDKYAVAVSVVVVATVDEPIPPSPCTNSPFFMIQIATQSIENLVAMAEKVKSGRTRRIKKVVFL